MGERVLTKNEVEAVRAGYQQTSSAQAGDGPNPDHDERVVRACDELLSLRAALTQSAERVRHLEAIPWTCAYCGEAFAGADRPRESLQAHVAVCEKHPLRAATEKVARLERTVEGMREALQHAATRLQYLGDTVAAPLAWKALAASSPDHAGAPESGSVLLMLGDEFEMPEVIEDKDEEAYRKHGKRPVVRATYTVPSVEAGEGETT